MWQKTFLLLLHTLEAAVASQCWQGATFSEAVVSPDVESSGILRVPGTGSLPQCVTACCDMLGFDLAWLFKGRCYILNCQQRENCQLRQRPGADSILAFVRRAPLQTLVLQSLVRGEPYSSHWRALSQFSKAPDDLEALRDLTSFDTPQRDSSEPDVQDEGYVQESKQGVGGASDAGKVGDGQSGLEILPDLLHFQARDRINQSEAVDGPEGRTTDNNTTQIRASSEGNVTLSDQDRTMTQRPAEETNKSQSSSDSTSVTWSPQKPTTGFSHQEHIKPSGSAPVLHWPSSASTETETVNVLPDRAPPTTSPQAWTVTSDPSTTPQSAITASATTPVSRLTGLNRGPAAVVGPDRKLFLPLDSVLLDGSGSSDDRSIVSYRWDAVSGPPGLKLEDVDQPVATATGLQAGRYTFRLTVADQEGATDSTTLNVRIMEAAAKALPLVAHTSGTHTLILPNNSLVLRGSVTHGEQTDVHFLWVRDAQSPAAGDVLYGSDTQASLYLANLVEGTYLFQLRVTDTLGRSSSATATIKVQPEPSSGEEVELEMLVLVSQVSVAQRDMVVRQLAAVLHVLDNDIQVRALQGRSHLSTVLRLSVRGPRGPVPGSRVVGLLRKQLLRDKSDFLLFRVLRIDTVSCLLRCSGHGQCDPITKECVCDTFWMDNLIRRFLGDGESNCEWQALYVILTSFVVMIVILSISWTFICCCKRRRHTRVKKKTKYTILDNVDDQERVELRPKFSIKHRSTEHNSSLMMSESELDSDQDTLFSRDRSVRSRNRLGPQASNGNVLS
ncbi:dyslexia-associated protein KIAA0319 isoform X2 [Thalassophryne amazonica]|uniref:dyslexia-associated protein KIAA0319 isoform X2 n=1 Tax=Thalassophryne amazonica TaxID=390379 RepID=UPI0014718BB5|nr:dyslexia-associated protein KIAA0319 isoform X2 [Thalassophryne amazonica]